ncbi:unnamed protein product [Psylliodes chrysocephalus]|uniref:DUF243 domain-containing protein n=1 Tax=Psylliodes chrysocephalus TaxID=3402493 RepID=A0A9P0CHS3_9CUCU|nr:unnamed protein product [Psylliodes chrysocephala]
MNPLILLPAILALVQARPQGYDYPVPSGGPFNLDNGYTSGSSSSSVFQSGLGSNHFSNPGSIVTKHIYVHVPPPDLEEQQQRLQPVFYPPKKTYKIIFIKTPTAPAASYASPSVIQPQSQDKTLIYVLVKKPEDQADIQIPEVVPTQPSKPEVYFIRYKSRKSPGGNGGPFEGFSGSGPASSFADPSAGGSLLGTDSFGSGSFPGYPTASGSSHSSSFHNGISGSKPSSSYGPPGNNGGPY